ncbi:MAG TPA: hypothetical protein VMZ71_15925, partial [Gemmataceae bacterium]|nr:hypothetical protein [Gemmataceae bacterium]
MQAKWAKRLVWGTLAVVVATGCNPLTMAAFIFNRDTKLPAEYPFQTKDEKKESKKDEVTVAVFTNLSPGAVYEFAGGDRELATMFTKRLTNEVKINKEKITVVTPAEVDKFKMANPNWKHMHPTAWGKKLNADFVLDIHVGNITVFQPGSGNHIYEGRAEVSVDVYDVAKQNSESKHKYVHSYAYPKTGMI